MPADQPSSPSDCRCAPSYRKPKPNGTCATCGGWLPGERPKPLPFTLPPELEAEIIEQNRDLEDWDV